ncbi:MAG: NUDIX domain-containing protein [Patescibacteria group bacterium]
MKIKYPRLVLGAFILNDQGELFLRTTPSQGNKFTCVNGALEWGRTIEKALAKNVRDKTNLELDSCKLISLTDGLNIEISGERELVNMVFADYIVTVKSNHKFKSDSDRECKWLLPSEWLKMDKEAFAPYIYEIIEKLV